MNDGNTNFSPSAVRLSLLIPKINEILNKKKLRYEKKIERDEIIVNTKS